MKRAILGIVAVAFACGGSDNGSEARQVTPATDGETSAMPAGGAQVTGMVMFSGTPPENPPVDMQEEAACAEKHGGAPVDRRVIVTGGHVANVFVHVKSGLPAGNWTAPSAAAVIDQDGCFYEPRVVGVMVGQPLEITNSDPLLHNIKAVPTVNRGFNISQPRAGMRTTRTFNSPEVMVPLECNVHGWMHAFVGVKEHPFFAVTGEDGRFSITGLPAGTYEIEAWHETLGTRTMSVTVPEDGSATADFTYSSTAT